MQAHLKSSNQALLDKINASGDFNDEIAAEMKAAIEQFKSTSTW